jgi:hypothetical protein
MEGDPMEKLTLHPLMLLSRLGTSGTVRRYARGRGGLLVLTIFLLAAGVSEPREPGASGIGHEIAIGTPANTSREPPGRPGAHDAVYDRFLQNIKPLRTDVARRRYLVAEVVTAAIANRLDPDLLFALVAVESNFNSTAVSPKGARGLGQVMFATGQTVAPTLVRRPEDLYNVPRNLHVAALYLRRLLIERDGDLRAALTAYHSGSAAGHSPGRDEREYVDRICRHFASLKTKREYADLLAATPGDPATVETTFRSLTLNTATGGR